MVFPGRLGLQESKVPETRGKVWSKDDIPLVEEDQVRENLNKSDIDKCTGPDRMYPIVTVSNLASVVVGSLLNLERSELVGEVLVKERKANVTAIFRKGKKVNLGNYRTVKVTSFSGKVVN